MTQQATRTPTTNAASRKESVRLLAGIADRSKDGLVSFCRIPGFEGLLCTPDALYKTAFQLFDRQGNGTVSYGKERLINYAEFTQLLHDFHEEYAMEAFRSKDPAGSGYISP
ncbi:Calcium-binding mitochondrial carrier protein Aralar1 [Eumeta japonica]|uniref:Calcium-binding mitochondrial carrier protein Aralar1 n=1 Tax=Eumeta variegata TaxID=151549 RepID=A0A4C2ADK7_EUMVA|nr:Calcium-binding mitochondrial carrier protein Aralar1 [Eumeta japonica]